MKEEKNEMISEEPTSGLPIEVKPPTKQDVKRAENMVHDIVNEEARMQRMAGIITAKDYESHCDKHSCAATLGLGPEDFDKIDRYEEMEEQNKKLIEQNNMLKYQKDSKGFLDKALGKFASRKLLAFIVTTVAFFMGLLVSQYYMAIVVSYIGTQAVVDMFNSVNVGKRDIGAGIVPSPKATPTAPPKDDTAKVDLLSVGKKFLV
jgi:hypothetical protein